MALHHIMLLKTIFKTDTIRYGKTLKAYLNNHFPSKKTTKEAFKVFLLISSIKIKQLIDNL